MIYKLAFSVRYQISKPEIYTGQARKEALYHCTISKCALLFCFTLNKGLLVASVGFELNMFHKLASNM